MVVADSQFTWIFFKRDWLVFEMASKKGVSRLPARVSRVFELIVKHFVMLLSRISLTVGWVGILWGESWCVRDSTHLSCVRMGLSFSLASVHLPHRGCDAVIWCRAWSHQMIPLNEQMRSRKNVLGSNWETYSIESSTILLWYCDIFPCSANAHDGQSRVQLHGVNRQSI
jgi:hypothetical protein